MDSRYLPLGWLSPSGEFVDCNHFDHFSVARDILDRLDLDALHTLCRHPDDKLLELGWVHITICTLGKRELVIF